MRFFSQKSLKRRVGKGVLGWRAFDFHLCLSVSICGSNPSQYTDELTAFANEGRNAEMKALACRISMPMSDAMAT